MPTCSSMANMKSASEPNRGVHTYENLLPSLMEVTFRCLFVSQR